MSVTKIKKTGTIYDDSLSQISVFGGSGLIIPSGEFEIDQDLVVFSNSDVTYTTKAFDLEGNDLGEDLTIIKQADFPFAFKKGVVYNLQEEFTGERM